MHQLFYLRNNKSFSFTKSFPHIKSDSPKFDNLPMPKELKFSEFDDYIIHYYLYQNKFYYCLKPISENSNFNPFHFVTETEFDERDIIEIVIGVSINLFNPKKVLSSNSIPTNLFFDVSNNDVMQTFMNCLLPEKDYTFFSKFINEFVKDVNNENQISFYDKGNFLSCQYRRFNFSFHFNISLKYYLMRYLGTKIFKQTIRVKTEIIKTHNRSIISDKVAKKTLAQKKATLMPRKKELKDFSLLIEHSRDLLPIFIDFINAYNTKSIHFEEIQLESCFDGETYTYLNFKHFSINQLAQFELIGTYYKRYSDFFHWFIRLGRLVAFVVEGGSISAASAIEIANVTHISIIKKQRKAYYSVPIKKDALEYWDKNRSYQNLLPNLAKAIISKYDYRNAVYFFLNKFTDNEITLEKIFEIAEIPIEKNRRSRNIQKAKNILDYIISETQQISSYKIKNMDATDEKNIIFEIFINKALTN